MLLEQGSLLRPPLHFFRSQHRRSFTRPLPLPYLINTG